MQQRMAKRNVQGGAVSGRAVKAGSRAATRAPEGVCAGIFVANRSSARAERRERRRGPTAGAAGLRRANVSRDSKRLGARGSAWPCVSEVAAAARAPVPMVQLERGARVPRHFLELCEWFRDCSQASGASQRVQRASAPRPTPVGCGAGGPAQHGPPRGRSRDRALLNSIDAACLVARVHSLASAVRVGPASHESQCAARRAWPAGALRDGVDSLCADRRRCAPWERGVSGSGGARACSRERAGARATPTQ